jgi:hypothetical protein
METLSTKRSRIVACVFAAALLMPSFASSAPFGFSVREQNNNLYRIDLATGVATSLGSVGLFAGGMAFGPGGNLYGIGGSVDQLWNLTTPPGFLVGNTGPRDGTDAGLGFNSATGIMYNLNAGAPPVGPAFSSLYRINLSTGAATFVGTSTVAGADNIAIRGGTAYAIDAVDPAFGGTDSLYTVNLATGALSFVGSLVVGFNDLAGSDFDSLGTLWMIGDSGTATGGGIFTVDTATGLASFVATPTDSITHQFLFGFQGLAIAPLAVPEPAGIALVASGLVALFGLRRRRVGVRSSLARIA